MRSSEEQKARMRAYYQANREAILARQREYLGAHPEVCQDRRINCRTYQAEHQDDIRAYRRRRYADPAYQKAQKERSRASWWKRKQEAIASLGGKCVRCGTTEKLEFDHIDPSGKKKPISQFLLLPEKLKEELAKCQLLCEGCHMKKSAVEQSERCATRFKRDAWGRFAKQEEVA